MKRTTLLVISLSFPLVLAFSIPASATQIDFTAGTVVLNDASTQTTNNSVVWQDVDYYEEDGFKLDFIPSTGNSFESIIGDYYGAGNDVIHGHWATGDYGGLTQIKVTKLDNTAFDLNYFVLTSNTDAGGSFASGNERAYIHASIDGINSSYSELLPPENWGFPATQIFLNSNFDNIKAFWFTAENAIDCFGMDNFYIDEEFRDVPEPASLLGLLGFGAFGSTLKRKKKIEA
jgi:PEP-CTERM motif